MTQSTNGRVSREKRGRIMLIGLDRAAKRNAFDLEMLADLCLAYGEFERDGEARVALIHAMANISARAWTWPRSPPALPSAGRSRPAVVTPGACSAGHG